MGATAGVVYLKDRTKAQRTLLSAGVLAALAYWLARVPVTWGALTLTGAALALATLALPAVGLAAIGLFIPLSGLVELPLPVIEPVDLLVGLATVAWLAQGVARRRIVFQRPPLAVSLMVFVWLAGLSLTQASSWREGLPEWLKWVEFAAVYLVGCQILTRRSSARWLVVALLVAGSAEALLGIYQFVRQVGPEAFVLMGRFMRAHGTFQQPNPYAGYLGYLLPVAASLTLGAIAHWWRDRTTRQAVAAGLYGLVAGLLALGILMSWSRGAWLGAAASALVVVGFRNRRTALLSLFAVLLLGLLISVSGVEALPGSIGARLNDLGGYFSGPDPARTEITDANFSVLERLAHWRAGWQMFEAHPWLGVGLGNYAVTYSEYQLPHWYRTAGACAQRLHQFPGGDRCPRCRRVSGLLGPGACHALAWGARAGGRDVGVHTEHRRARHVGLHHDAQPVRQPVRPAHSVTTRAAPVRGRRSHRGQIRLRRSKP